MSRQAVRRSHKGPGIAAVPGSHIKRAGERVIVIGYSQLLCRGLCTPVTTQGRHGTTDTRGYRYFGSNAISIGIETIDTVMASILKVQHRKTGIEKVVPIK